MPKLKTKDTITAELPQNVVTFEPTPTMRVWLDTAIKLATDSPTEIAKESKIARQTWYDWMDVSGFEDWYYEEYKKKRKRWLPALDSIGLKHASKGDYQFWRDMNKKAGEILDGASTNVQVNVLNQIKSDKKEFEI